jgi:predicted ATPase
MVAGILCLRGDFALARQTSDRASAIAEEHGIEHQVRAAGAQRAWLSIVEGERENALDLIRSGWEDYLSSRRFTPIPIGPLLLLDACRAVGAADEGLRMAEEVWQSTRASGVRWYDAELQRLRGELILLQGKRDARAEAAACFRRALAIAHQQGARFCELRSATSLARLCRGRRNERDVRATLERVYLGFTEGLETPDLRAAEECLRT